MIHGTRRIGTGCLDRSALSLGYTELDLEIITNFLSCTFCAQES